MIIGFFDFFLKSLLNFSFIVSKDLSFLVKSISNTDSLGADTDHILISFLCGSPVYESEISKRMGYGKCLFSYSVNLIFSTLALKITCRGRGLSLIAFTKIGAKFIFASSNFFISLIAFS